ncbi:MAG TPA: polysaccharide biosynthesis tyrosine autokinase [Geminicoccaceae bacterium]|nr:polysaccharide biosynthesis tyrosine autokinase [Geminicoccaceae bacterium]
MTAPQKPARIEHDGTFGAQTYGAEPRLGLRDLVKVLRRRRSIIFGTVAVTTLASAFLAYYMTPQYTAASAISIEPQKTRVLNTEAVIEQLPQDPATIETEVKLLTSRSFANYAIEVLGLLDDPDFNPVLRAQREKAAAAQVAQAPKEGLDALIAEYIHPLAQWLPDSWLVATGLANPALPPVEPDPYAQQAALEGAIDTLLGGLNVAQAGESYVIGISYTSPDPQEAATIANQVADLYVENRLDTKRSANSRAADWLSERADQLRAALHESEAAIAAYRAEHELMADSRGIMLDDETVAALNRELIAARAERTQRAAKLDQVRKLRGRTGGLESIMEVIGSPVIGQLRQQEADLLRQEAQLSQEYGVNHPTLIQLKAERQKLATKIDIEIGNVIRGLENELAVAESRISALEEHLGQAKQHIVQNRAAQVNLRELEREAEANRLLYTTVLNRSKELSEQDDLTEAGARVISRATAPTRPSFPQPKLMIAVGFTGSLMLGMLFAIAAEGLESGLRSGRQVEQVLGVPHLGLVPRIAGLKGEKPHQYLMQKPRSAYAEAVRAVQVGLHFSNHERPPQLVLVTSSLPGEGKTTLALSLATTAARSGHKSIVVDLDLRHPSVRRELGQAISGPGLVEVVSGEHTLDEVIYRDDAIPNLHAITIGRSTSNPTDLLASPKLLALLTELRSRYNYIILDAPPLLGLADTRIAARLADAVLFVVRWGKTNDEVAVNGIDALLESRTVVAGAVLTQVDIRKHTKRAYGDALQYYGKYEKYYIN